MRKFIGYLFPWQPTFRRLKLEKLWWHRLAVVLFFFALIPPFVYSWALGDDLNSPVNSFQQDIIYWDSSPSSGGDIFDQVAGVTTKTIPMPDGTTATYPSKTSDETIKAEWKHKLNIAIAKAAAIGFGIAILVAVIFSYLLQAGYRAVLYVIYGATAESPAE